MASLEVHFVDGPSGLCVQTLTVNRDDMTLAAIRADLTANKPATQALAFPAQGHVCKIATPTQAQIDLQAKADQLAVLRAKGWANLTLAEQTTAKALAFDLGQWAPA